MTPYPGRPTFCQVVAAIPTADPDSLPAAFVRRRSAADVVTGSQVWDPAVAARELPESLYLPAAPAFSGDLPWPWVDPASGTTHVLPARLRFDRIHGLARGADRRDAPLDPRVKPRATLEP